MIFLLKSKSQVGEAGGGGNWPPWRGGPSLGPAALWHRVRSLCEFLHLIHNFAIQKGDLGNFGRPSPFRKNLELETLSALGAAETPWYVPNLALGQVSQAWTPNLPKEGG